MRNIWAWSTNWEFPTICCLIYFERSLWNIMSRSCAQNIFIPANINSIVLSTVLIEDTWHKLMQVPSTCPKHFTRNTSAEHLCRKGVWYDRSQWLLWRPILQLTNYLPFHGNQSPSKMILVQKNHARNLKMPKVESLFLCHMQLFI